ncbi:MAG: hypothetical protein NVSMB22_22380 [Chloroflexota bacterium]
MSDTTDLIERSGDLKEALLAFAQNRRYRRYLREAMQERFGEVVVGDEAEVGNFFDSFLLQHRLPDGRTLIEHFVTAHPKLPERERAMLLGWQDVVEGIFAVQRREQDAIVVVNLIDDLIYRVRSNMGPRALAPMRPGSFLVTRLVPVGAEWLLSGFSHLLPASQRRDALAVAERMALLRPALAFRNPEKLEQAWTLQRQERQDFIAFFGSDLVVVAGREVQDRLDAYYHFRMDDLRDAQGRSMAERAEEEYGVVPDMPDMDLDIDLVESETVGVIFDEVDGFNLFPDFGLVDETFATPRLVSDRRHREAVLGYLESSEISPLPLRRLAERNPEQAGQVFRQLLHQPGFDWERDGDALLRRYKAQYFERPPLPSVVPVNTSSVRERLAGMQGKRTPARGGQGRRSRSRGKKSRR